MTRRQPGRDPVHRRHRHLQAAGESPGPSPEALLDDVSTALADPDPLRFLSLASSIVSAFDPRSSDPAAPGDVPDAAMLLESFIGHSAPETTALLLALAQLLPDNHLAQRARREARRRDHALPEWLLWLDEAAPGPAAASVDVLGDAQNTIVSVHLAGGEALTAVVLIDHNLGTVGKDGFVIPTDLASFRERYLALSGEADAIEFIDLDPAEARAQIAQAVEAGAMMTPPFETNTWPAARPIVEWVAGLLPGGGTGFTRPEWTHEDRTRLVLEFLRSEEGAELTGTNDGAIADDLLWFTTEYSGGDPWRWSFVNVEILLTHWYPQTLPAGPPHLRRVPTVLRAMVRYAHRLKQIPPALTQETLAAIDEYEPVYRQLIDGSPGPFGYAGYPDSDAFYLGYGAYPRDNPADVVGGAQALAELDDTPLPDEEFQWAGIPEDVNERVAEILDLCDGCADELFDVEMRTAFRRVLARTAAREPAVFRRRSKNSTAAAAIAWAVASVNDRLGQYAGGLTAKALLAHFGVTGSVSERAQPFLRAFGAYGTQWSGNLTFGTPDVLTSDRRARLIEIRDGDGEHW